MSGNRPWTREEDQLLLDGAGVFAVHWFERKIGRSTDAIYRRAYDLYGGGLSRGTHTLLGAARETGYGPSQLLRGQRALNQKWKRLSVNGPYLITFDQLTELTDWLRQDYWCQKLRLYGCVNCGSDDRPPRGKGLCSRDYERIRYLCRTHQLPSSLSLLSELSQALDGNGSEVRALRERLDKGWGPTEQQVMMLATAA